jgi:hypothetical protein
VPPEHRIIDVVFRGTSRKVDVTFVMAPHADPDAIAVELDDRPLRIDRGAHHRVSFSIELPEAGQAQEPPRVGTDAEGNLFLAARAGGAITLVTVLDPRAGTFFEPPTSTASTRSPPSLWPWTPWGSWC